MHEFSILWVEYLFAVSDDTITWYAGDQNMALPIILHPKIFPTRPKRSNRPIRHCQFSEDTIESPEAIETAYSAISMDRSDRIGPFGRGGKCPYEPPHTCLAVRLLSGKRQF